MIWKITGLYCKEHQCILEMNDGKINTSCVYKTVRKEKDVIDQNEGGQILYSKVDEYLQRSKRLNDDLKCMSESMRKIREVSYFFF